MPIFEYKCDKCGHEFEALIMTTRDKPKTCPKCNHTKVSKLISRTGAVSRGRGASGCASPSGSGFS